MITITKNELPYEKFMKSGAGALSDAELLAIIIRTGTANSSAVTIARQILQRSSGSNEGLNVLHHISLQELKRIPGIGEIKAIKIKCIAELSRRMARQRAEKNLCFSTPSTIADYYMEELRHEECEKVILLLLDNKLQFMEDYMVSKGTVNASLLSSREVFRYALRHGACKIVLLHNHPSGNPAPSRQDIEITTKIKEAGLLMEIPLMDHIILGDGCYVSLKEYGYL